MSTLISHREGPRAHLVLNKPTKHNCIDLPMLEALSQELERLAMDESLKLLVLEGAGEKAFSSGADLKAFGALSQAEIPGWIELGHHVCTQLAQFPRATLALVRGYALGGGLELALACDLRWAVGECWLGFPELRHGWLPGWGGTYRLPALVGASRAAQLIFEGQPIGEQKALSWGLVNEWMSPQQLPSRLEGFTQNLQGVPSQTLAQAKQILTGFQPHPTPTEIQLDVEATQAARQAGSQE